MKRIGILISLMIFTNMAFAQKDTLPEIAPYFSAIIVKDLNTSLNWYVEKLGFAVFNKTELAARGIKQANLTRAGMAIELIELGTAITQDTLLTNFSQKTKIQGFFKLGFQVRDFDKWMLHLEATKANFYGGVVKDPVSGKRMVLITDPDGNRLQLFEQF